VATSGISACSANNKIENQLGRSQKIESAKQRLADIELCILHMEIRTAARLGCGTVHLSLVGRDCSHQTLAIQLCKPLAGLSVTDG
jgi:hypothetical protein